MFVQLHLPLDVRTLIRKHFSVFELSHVVICTLAVGLLSNDCLYCLLHVNILYVFGCVWIWLLCVPHNPVSSMLHPLISHSVK